MAHLTVDIQPSPVARPFHLLLTRPVVDLDGTETESTWGRLELPVEDGPHTIAVFFRYRGQRSARLALSREEFTVTADTAEIRLTARLGARNGSRFTLTQG